MSRDDKNMTKLAAALLLGAAPFSAAWCAEGGSWDWVIAPYLRAPAIGSDLHIDVPPINSGGTTQFSDLVGNLGFTVPFHLEGQGEEWGLFSNLLYLPLSDSASAIFLPLTPRSKPASSNWQESGAPASGVTQASKTSPGCVICGRKWT